MGRVQDFAGRFHISKLFTATGVIGDAYYERKAGETSLQTATVACGSASRIKVQGQLRDEAAWTDITTLSGTAASTTSDISKYDLFRLNCTVYDDGHVDEVQKIAFSAVPDAGSFKIAFGSYGTTALIAHTANAAAVQAAIRLLTGLGSITVSGNFTAGFSITFTGIDGGVAACTTPGGDNSLTNTAVPVTTTITEETAGVAAGAPQVIASGFFA
jgi:hypothetical protein